MDAVERLTRAREHTALFVDFDGTLAPIVADAGGARALPGVDDLLVELSRSFAVMAVVSGRPVAYLVDHLPPAIELHGLYGLERRAEGRVDRHPSAEAWRGVVDEVAVAAVAELPGGVDVEHKGLSVTLHFRQTPEAEAAIRDWGARCAERSGLDVRSAKMSLELHPPVGVDKGTIVTARSAGCTAACYVGDDVGDLPAFDALDALRDEGMDTVKVAVRTSESSTALMAQADVEVDGPPGVLAFLGRLR